MKRILITPILREGETPSMFKASNDAKRAMAIHIGHRSYSLTREMVCCFFDIPAVEAARIMRVSLSTLKKIRSWVRLDRWPCTQIHNRRFKLTLPHIVKGRNAVICGLERDFLDVPSGMVVMALNIMREAREYAQTYLCLVSKPENKEERKELDMVNLNVKVEEVDITTDDWPSFPRIDYPFEVEDVLGLGPVID
jgi:RWP-RK domain